MSAADPYAIARFAGEYALAGFFMLLFALLLIVPAAWRFAQRRGVPREEKKKKAACPRTRCSSCTSY